MKEMQLLHGDCLELMRNIPNGSVDMILCDLPYGTTNCKWDIIIPFEPLWSQYKRIIKKRGAIVLFGSEPFSSHLRLSNLKWFKYDWIWDKVTARGHLVAKKRPLSQTECISVFYNSSPKYNPQMIKRPKDKIKFHKITEYSRTEIISGSNNSPKNKIYDEWYPTTLLSFSNAGSSKKSVHPTQKPVPLLEYLIRTYTIEGETVLDNAMGSGSTGVACLNSNRNFIGIEKDAKYFEIAKNRIEQHVPPSSVSLSSLKKYFITES